MAKTRAEKRQTRRRRRKVKASFRKGVFIFAFIVLAAGFLGYRYYLNTQMSDMFGDIKTNGDEEEEPAEITKGVAKYTVFDAGGGESILIQYGSVDMLIDTGTADGAEALCKKLSKRVSGDLDYLVLTGDSEKRIGGAQAVFDAFKVSTCIVGDMGNKDREIKKLASAAGTAVSGDNLSFSVGDDATLFVLKPDVSSSDKGDRSLVTYFTFYRTGFLALSDAGKEEISRVFGSVSACNAIVLARHGSEKENKAIPVSGSVFCIASAAKDSGVPSSGLMDALHARFYTTGAAGDIELVSDGSNVSLSNEDEVKAKMESAAADSDEAEDTEGIGADEQE